MRWPSALALLLCGCDLGLSIDNKPCGDDSFASAKAFDVATANYFSVAWDRDRIAYSPGDGLLWEAGLPGLTNPKLVDIGAFNVAGISLAPEGNAVFYTAELEPPELFAVVRAGDAWTADPILPLGTFAGTPSAGEFGPRHLIVQLRQNGTAMQEYVEDHGHWSAVGGPHEVVADRAPNLTPNGLDMVYADGSAVYIAHRASVATWFGAPATILTGDHRSPQLLGACTQLFVVDNTGSAANGGTNTVRRYDR